MGSLIQQQIWLIWAVNLLAQNFMFTFVSRARNSGSLKRHVIAAVGSNGVWILQLQIMLGPMMDYLNGKHGLLAQVGVGVFYTVFTVAGSVFAHYWALRTEKGKSAVGASSKYAQIPVAEWERIKKLLDKCGACDLDGQVMQLRSKVQADSCLRKIEKLEEVAQELNALGDKLGGVA